MKDAILCRLFKDFAAPGAAFLFAANMVVVASAAEGQGRDSPVNISSEVYYMTPSQAEATFQQLRSLLKTPVGQVQGGDGSSSGSTNGGFPGKESPPVRGGGNSSTPATGSPPVGGDSGGYTSGGPHCPPDTISAGNRCIRNPGGPASDGGSGSGSVLGSGTSAPTGTIAESGAGSSTSNSSACPAGEISIPVTMPTLFAAAPNGHGPAAGAVSQSANQAGANVSIARHCIPLPQPPMACPGGGQASPDPNMNAALSQSGFVVEHWVCPSVGVGGWCPHIVGPVYPIPAAGAAVPTNGIINSISGAISEATKAPQLVMGDCLPQQSQGIGPGGQNCRNLPPGFACTGGGTALGGAAAPAAAGGAIGIMQSLFPQPYKYCTDHPGGVLGTYILRQIEVCQSGIAGEQTHFFALPSQVSGRMAESDGAVGLWDNQGTWQSVFMTRVKNITIEGLSDARHVGQILDFETDNPAMSCLNGESVDLWTAPKEFPGMLVAHNGAQGSQCTYGTWTFPASPFIGGSLGATNATWNNLAGFFGGL